MEHLRKVFQVLRENELYIKREKCEFSQSKVHFLGHVISNGKLRMNEDKVHAIQEWETLIKVTALRSFLVLVNYYRRFISGYSAKAALLTKLLKKNKPWVWMEHYQKAFECLKASVTEEPVLALPDFAKTFEVHIDASDFAIEGVLMQDKHLITFESRKLNEMERRYTMQEKEMTAITLKKITPKQARWQDFLAEFDYALEYKPGKGNIVADALSRKADLAAITSARWDIWETIKEGMQHDPAAKHLIEFMQQHCAAVIANRRD
ncbi:putative mitochondrial protein AtMg00860 [Nicotiana tabacum]|uniref:Mitochondrial protein AtMg00860 n=1 Tax=Nicotiana tabacum TaxID=4097 RepID=A0AC58TH78_TOBAC